MKTHHVSASSHSYLPLPKAVSVWPSCLQLWEEPVIRGLLLSKDPVHFFYTEQIVCPNDEPVRKQPLFIPYLVWLCCRRVNAINVFTHVEHTENLLWNAKKRVASLFWMCYFILIVLICTIDVMRQSWVCLWTGWTCYKRIWTVTGQVGQFPTRPVS